MNFLVRNNYLHYGNSLDIINNNFSNFQKNINKQSFLHYLSSINATNKYLNEIIGTYGTKRKRKLNLFDFKRDIRNSLIFKSKFKELHCRGFSYYFVDQKLAARYESERQLGKILTLFTIFAFFVSCLGLIGLSVFASEQRKKEIGLRKVNGSGIGQIIWLLSVDFTRLVAISFVASIPVTVIFMKKWLDSFAYRTELSWWIFGITFLMTYAVAMIAIIFQSYQAAASNPVDTFRTE